MAGMPLPPMERRKDVLLDRWHSHTAQCKTCQRVRCLEAAHPADLCIADLRGAAGVCRSGTLLIVQALSWYHGLPLPCRLLWCTAVARASGCFVSFRLRMTSELNPAQGFKLVKAAQIAAVALAVVLAWGLAAALGQGVAPLSKVSACILVGERQKTTPCVMWLLNAVTTPTKLDMMMLPQAYCIFWTSSAQKPVKDLMQHTWCPTDSRSFV